MDTYINGVKQGCEQTIIQYNTGVPAVVYTSTPVIAETPISQAVTSSVDILPSIAVGTAVA